MEVLISAGTSVAVGLFLWAVLPRGVVLTRTPSVGPSGQPVPDTWTVKNESALPIRITRVTYQGIGTMNFETERFEEVPLPVYDPEGSGGSVTLELDDSTLEVARIDQNRRWPDVVVPPGDTLSAWVNLNTTLRIRYRRRGVTGLLERRAIRIDGDV